MNDLFHALLEYLNNFPLDYKPIPINDFLLRSGYIDDSLNDAETIKGVIVALENQKFFFEIQTFMINIEKQSENLKSKMTEKQKFVEIEEDSLMIGRLVWEGINKAVLFLGFFGKNCNGRYQRLPT